MADVDNVRKLQTMGWRRAVGVVVIIMLLAFLVALAAGLAETVLDVFRAGKDASASVAETTSSVSFPPVQTNPEVISDTTTTNEAASESASLGGIFDSLGSEKR